MLVICALVLLVAAAVFLVIGLAGGEVGDLYLSMVLCLASLAVVAVSARLSRVRPAPAADEPPEPVDPHGAAAAEAELEAEAARDAELREVGRRELTPTPAPAEPSPGPQPVATAVADPIAGLGDRLAKPEPAPVPAVDDGSIWAAPQDEVEGAPQVEVEPFPIADYDDLAAEQILPLVPRLWPEEIPVVAERERSTKARPAVLDALAEAVGDPSLAFPIAEYESLDTEQITRLLARLDEADLATVQAAERSGPARVGVLVAVANQLAARK